VSDLVSRPERQRDPSSDAYIKHLEFIQGVIGRLANNSFLMKGWALTVAGAFFGFAVTTSDWRLAATGLLPVVAFWGLDAYFLRLERLFRCLYDQVRRPESEVELFSMDVRAYQTRVKPWWRTFFTRSLLPFYGMILFVGLILILGAVHYSSSEHAFRISSATSSFTASPQGSLGGQMFPIWSSNHRGTT
jgi:hypothetical protein